MHPSFRTVIGSCPSVWGAPLFVAVLLGGCVSRPSDMTPDESSASAADAALLTDAERAQGWRVLFDGRSTAGWRGYRRQSVPNGWQVVDGELARVGRGGDLITVDQFGDFELALEWKVGPAGNSGVFYRVTEEGEETYHTGIEMQVLDDAGHADGGSRLTSAGSLYGLYPAPPGVVRPAGEWNSARIVARGNHVEHWLNGQRIVEAELWGDDWNARLAASKFTQWPGFARSPRGHIGLQDHGDPVRYRNIKIRELR
ncbi:MAG TPA: DUF1080 domain-containing protein [Gemmatimonadaceae bacterium]|nr:DUF1080 domain-containing protein [Gemmatimonadaceae bacterium]